MPPGRPILRSEVAQPTGATRRRYRWRLSLKATEVIEALERQVYEFGDGEVQLPDPVERWWYPVDRVEFDTEQQVHRVVSDH
jgi:predicted nucleotidyltransferase